jgi:hypothetical protein
MQYATSTHQGRELVMSSGNKTTTAVHGEQGEGTGLGYRPKEPAMADRPEIGGARVAAQVSLWQLNLLRVGYLVMGGGLAVVKWPLLFNHGPWELKEGTVECMLVAMSLLALLGLRYPVRMLPILLFEVSWKLIWLSVVALPLWLDNKLAGDTRAQAGAVLWVVIIIAVIPWRYVLAKYVTAPGDPLHRRR